MTTPPTIRPADWMTGASSEALRARIRQAGVASQSQAAVAQVSPGAKPLDASSSVILHADRRDTPIRQDYVTQLL